MGVAEAHWIGAVSFEDRGVSSLRRLDHSAAVAVSTATLVEYPTKLDGSDGEELRRAQRSAIRSICDADSIQQSSEIVHPYRSADLLGVLNRVSGSREPVVVDITCLTKVHKITVARWAYQWSSELDIFLSYSKPERYLKPASLGTTTQKWRDVVLAPMADSRYESSSDADEALDGEGDYGLLLLGHEGARTRAAMSYLELGPSLVIHTAEPGATEPVAEDVVARTEHAMLLAEIERGERLGWRVASCGVYDVNELLGLVRDWSDQLDGGRRVLLPYGPGPSIVAGTLGLLDSAPGSCWFLYPVPVSYDVNYSVVTAEVRWWKVRREG